MELPSDSFEENIGFNNTEARSLQFALACDLVIAFVQFVGIALC
jgi:hypothetical protein